jgi:hypothetical protein
VRLRSSLFFACLLSFTAAWATPGPKPSATATPVDGFKPYASIIPASALTMKGVFLIHRVKDKLYYEIPPSMLDRDFLWVTTFARVQTGFGYAGTEVQNRGVRWSRHEKRIFLSGVGYALTSEESAASAQALEENSLGPVIRSFDILTEGKDKAPVIDVTSLFTSGVAEFSPSGTNFKTLDATRTDLQRVKDFPRNVETEALLTYKLEANNNRQLSDGLSVDASLSSLSVVLHHSMVLLPEQPMKARLADSRVGYFTERHLDFSPKWNRSETRDFIARWRLEKKDPAASVSEPVKPIVYYLGREIPEKWRPWIKKGVENWQVPFEQAGFKRAIVARDAPDPVKDPDWDPDDVRYSTIRWLPSTTENAYGPHICDPRSGEILNADIKLFNDVLRLVTKWYFIQASPADPHARSLPLSDELMGRLLEYIVTHEVGHTLGLEHNMKASSAYSIAELRDPVFTRHYGTEASIMAYGRMNYVAQPGDHVRMIPKLGPYDSFAIEWGYKPLPGTTDSERHELDQIAARQVEHPFLRFGDGSAIDPARQTNNVGNDPIEATRLGLQNLDRVVSWIIPATCKLGEDYQELTTIYEALLDQRRTELEHVLAMVGGLNRTDWHYGHGDAVYTPVPATRQRAAVRFLLQQALHFPKTLLALDVLDRVGPAVRGKLESQQFNFINDLVAPSRLARMAEQNSTYGGGYTPQAVMSDVQSGVWSELSQLNVVIKPSRRHLQRMYLDAVCNWCALDSTSESQNTAGTWYMTNSISNTIVESEIRALGRHALVGLLHLLQADRVRAVDPATRQHLDYCVVQIQHNLTNGAVPAEPSNRMFRIVPKGLTE